MVATVDIDDLFEEIKLALVNEWQHLDLNETESEAVYNMIVETLAEFKSERMTEFQKSNPQAQPPTQ